MANRRRDPAKEVWWREMLARQAASGLSVRAFCKRQRLAESAFYLWRRTIRKRDGQREALAHKRDGQRKPAAGGRDRQSEPVAGARAFVPVVISGEGVVGERLVLKLAGELELHLPHATSAERVAQLVHALEARGES